MDDPTGIKKKMRKIEAMPTPEFNKGILDFVRATQTSTWFGAWLSSYDKNKIIPDLERCLPKGTIVTGCVGPAIEDSMDGCFSAKVEYYALGTEESGDSYLAISLWGLKWHEGRTFSFHLDQYPLLIIMPHILIVDYLRKRNSHIFSSQMERLILYEQRPLSGE